MLPKEQLQGLQIFQGVDLAPLDELLTQCPVNHFAAGTVLLTPEHKNTAMHVILEGSVSVCINNADLTPITSVGRGESIGEMSAHDGRDPSAIVRAETALQTLQISNDILFQMIDRSHAVARNLLYLLANRIRSGNQLIRSSLHLQKKLEQHANVDNLTGLNNRRWLDNYFEQVFSLSDAEKVFYKLSLLMIDVDHFKNYNDTHGHIAGDIVLQATARALKESVRSSDLVARYGGEEFVVILPDTSVAAAEHVAQKIHRHIGALDLALEGQPLPAISVSIGLAGVLKEDSASSLQHAADKALYQAKQEGRNRTCVAQRHQG